MALSSATGATTANYNINNVAVKEYCIINSSKNHPSLLPAYFGSVKRIISSKRQQQLVFRIRSTSAADESAATEHAPGWETPVEVSKGPPSLISILNVEKALRGIAITDADHYGRLGLRTGCSYDQVTSAYKNKVNKLMNEGNLPEEALSKELDLLKESHSILSSVEERRLYDWSLARTGKPDRYMWPSEVDITQIQDPGTPPPQEPEDVGPTRLLGYFMLGWFILSLVLFITFNR